jgi:hypothetical protein
MFLTGNKQRAEDLSQESLVRALRLEGPIDFGETGVLASLAQPLADDGIALFAISTFDTDYVLVRESDLARALAALEASFTIESARETR